MYDAKSAHAACFMDPNEVQASLTFADANATNAPRIDAILAKVAQRQGLSHREASLLLACQLPAQNEAILRLAQQIKLDIYGKRIVLFAPLYLSNYCVNSCVYCPYHAQNLHSPRRKLSQDEIAGEVIALQNMGHKRLALEAGEHPTQNPIEYILASIATIYSIKHKNGAIRRVNVNIAATTVENYRKLHQAGIGTYILFQETYDRQSYAKLHPAGPKSDYDYHTEAMDRAMQGGIDDVGLGVLFGLQSYRYEFAALLMHAEHLEARFGVGPHTISVPRVQPADDVHPGDFLHALSDAEFSKIIACIRLAVPYVGMIISTRESAEVRAQALQYGVSQISGGSRTTVGGYGSPAGAEGTAQFELSDQRSLDEVVLWLMQSGYIPSFCTACYREGRTGDRFMQLAKTGQIQNCCQPNALLTLAEYLQDYASEPTRLCGQERIAQELPLIPNERMRARTQEHLQAILRGERDFRV